MRILVFLFLGIFFFETHAGFESFPVQNGGRIKPFHTFAGETLTLIHGRESFQKQKAVTVVLSWPLFPQVWFQEKLIRIQSSKLKKALNLDKKKSLFSLKEILSNLHFQDQRRNLESLRALEKPIKGLDKELSDLEYKVHVFHSTLLGESFNVAPQDKSKLNEGWLSLKDFLSKKNKDSQFLNEILLLFLEPSKEEKQDLLSKKIHTFQKDVGTHVYATKMKTEVFLNKLSPFFWAMILYLLSVLALFFSRKKLGLTLASLAFFLHTLGFILRVYLTERAPVTNMYETVIWMPWGAVLIGFILTFFKKDTLYILGACIASFLAILITKLSPSILDPTLQPLVPVLRDNFWLTTHVLSVTLSYGAFALAWVLSNIALIGHRFRIKKYKNLSSSSLKVYETLKIGVVLLSIGIFLGGVWADYSWGRFWGWDPKETWALIALLCYLGVLHMRLTGWISHFYFLISSIVGFCLIIMAWYGVNYVLGAGLHSYGFGAGGSDKVGLVIALQFIWIFYLIFSNKKKKA